METPKTIATSSNAIPEAADGILAIKALAEQAQGFQIVNIDTEGLGEGLPKTVPLAIDLKGNSAVIRDIKGAIEHYRTGPERRKGTANVTTLQSFIELVNRHKDEGSVIFAKTAWPNPRLAAVVDYHNTDNSPRHSQHRIEYAFPITTEMKAWIDGNGKVMDQGEFASFIEEHAAELAAPTDEEKETYEPQFKERFCLPIELIDLSRHLEVFVGGKVKQSTRLSSGEKTIEFVDEHMDKNGQKIDVPGIFIVSVQSFIDGQFIRIPARLRYRIKSQTATWFYQLYRWDFRLREEVKADLDAAAKATALPAYEGAPEL
jgi:hypothetical protein